MDYSVKLSATERKAIEYLDEHSPTLTNSRKQGFYFATQAASVKADIIDWNKLSCLPLERLFATDGNDASSQPPSVIHLTAEATSFNIVADSIQKFFKLKILKKSFVIRMIIRFAISERLGEKTAETNTTQALSIEEKISVFKSLAPEEKLTEIYRLLLMFNIQSTTFL